MIRPRDNSDQLERFIDDALRDLGQRRAPPTLESRVVAELARRAALPWWRRHFAHWPLVARIAFVLASFGFIELTFITVRWVLRTIRVLGLWTALPTWIRTVAHLSSSLIDLSASLISLIPPLWWYGGLALGVLMYGTLFGLGAVGYHVLYAGPTPRGLPQR
jgi:hypothetical protein